MNQTTHRYRPFVALVACMMSTLPGLAHAEYTSANRNVLTQNTGSWSSSGVTLNGTQFIVRGLQGVGRVSASALQSFDGGFTSETLGSMSDMQITNWAYDSGAGTYSGVFNVLPDRGYNAGTTFSNYAARINTFDFNFTPYTSSAVTAQQNQIALSYTGSQRFTYDSDPGPGVQMSLTTGLVADSAAVSLFGQAVPTVNAATVIGSDGPLVNRLTVDAEGLVLDTRAGREGSGWVSDEYGAYLYHFNASKEIDGIVTVPTALVPHSPAGTTNFQADPPANGRRINQGLEGLAISPDGTRLFAMLQSATLQDSGSGNQGRTNARVVVYDITGSDIPTDPIEQYVVQLPRIDTDLSGTVDRAGAQSSILAISNEELLILSRDGNGRGVNGPTPVFKSVLLADLSSGTDFDGLYDGEGTLGDLTISGDILKDGIVPVQWTEALNMLGKLDLPITELEQFGLNLLASNGDLNTLSEKWEAMALVPTLDGHPHDYFLFIGNDNDFTTHNGFLVQADGSVLPYDAGLDNDTMVLAYRVSIVPVPGAVWLFGSSLLALVRLRRHA